ncbi:MAG TPA: thiamine-phosphate kinase [Terriglobia bacterium]|nr:thiamine-phosphate kinase [Terriglobia bacterium]
MKLRDLGEGGLIRKIRDRFKAAVVVPIGDDAAVFDIPQAHSVVFCSDLLAENSHFLRDLHPADSLGYKSVAANVSDVGAMGGTPLYFLISLAAPHDLDVAWIDAFLDGVSRACADFNIFLLGGDSSSSDRIFVDVSMIGSLPSGKAIRRSGAKPGDFVYVSGQLGGSALGFERMKAGDSNHPAVKRHLYPTPRHKLGGSLRDQAHAMIDVSDGLSTDLTHILEESEVSARIYKDRLPAWPGAEDHHVLHGGEEYELLVIASDLPDMIADVPLTRVGEIIDSGLEHQIFLIDGTREFVLQPKGWQHF